MTVVVIAALAAALAFGAFIAVLQVTHKSLDLTSSVASARLSAAHHRSADRTPGAPGARDPVHDALFVGASYTAGLGATPPSAGYAYLIGRQPGWQVQVNGVSGTGFLNPGPRGDQTFADRVDRLARIPAPDLVIFQGGRNDVSYPMPRLRTAIIATVDLARHRFVGAQIVLLGPIPARVPVPAGQLAVEAVLRSAARACHATFIDPIAERWITTQNEQVNSGHVPSHPGNHGYAYIAGRLLPNLTAILDERHAS